MCGIIGAVSTRDISELLISCLKKLEYRGYDSAGMVIIDSNKQLQRIRSVGKVNDLENTWQSNKINGKIGLSHTRWATHGKPSIDNAHPHISSNEIAIVHNGIIENNHELKAKLQLLGYSFVSETDTEVAAHLIHYHFTLSNNLQKALINAAKEMKGAFALGIIHKDYPNNLHAIRKGSPLVIGIGSGENFIASDPNSLSQLVNSVVYVEEGDCVELNSETYTVYNLEGMIIKRDALPFNNDAVFMTKGDFRHFMLKEIYEQPAVFARMLHSKIYEEQLFNSIFGPVSQDIFPMVEQIHIAACGTSYHAGLVAKYWLEELAHIPVTVEIASEYRYRHVAIPKNTLFIALSQSGETADTLSALQKAKINGYLATLAICNVANSSLIRESNIGFLTDAGPEIGVASTKAFTSQLVALLMLSSMLCKDQMIRRKIAADLILLPELTQLVFKQAAKIEKLSNLLVKKHSALFIARGVLFPIVLEGALKLKEISYIHAEAYAAGELKHGPLALVDEDMPVIALLSSNVLLDKMQSNIAEVSARDGLLITLIDENIKVDEEKNIILIPKCSTLLDPILYTIPLQLLAYYVAVAKGTDVDQPRNLAKSVTVE